MTSSNFAPQTFLNIARIDHRLVSSNNHASPTGSLPFLQPASSNSSQESPTPITSNKLFKYAADHGSRIEESSSMRYEAYQSLLDHRIRNAWVSFPQVMTDGCSGPDNLTILVIYIISRTIQLLSCSIQTIRLTHIHQPTRPSLNITHPPLRSRVRTLKIHLYDRHRRSLQ